MKKMNRTVPQLKKVCIFDLKKIFSKRKGFGLNEVIGIAAGIIIAVVVVIPGLQIFAGNVLAQLTNWWDGMAAGIFTN
jgi:hypothetical protein